MPRLNGTLKFTKWIRGFRDPAQPDNYRQINILAIAIFAAIFYLNSFQNFFVWNDWTFIIENFLIKDWRNLPEIFTSAFWKPLLGEPTLVYRPLTALSFMTDFSLWGLEPWGYHLTNTALHILNSVIGYFLVRNYTSATTAFMGSILFAVHPIHTEAVTYIWGRADLLMSFFLLAGTLLYLKSVKRRSRLLYAASLPLFLFALLSREIAFMFPLLLLTADYSLPWSRFRWIRHLGPLLVLVAYLIGRVFFVGGFSFDPGPAAGSFVASLLVVLKAIPIYVGLLLFPFNIQFIHPLAPFPIGGLVILSVLLLVGVGAGLGLAFRSGNQAAAFALMWFLAGLIPLIHLAINGLPLLEAWLYLPSLGFLLLPALGLAALRERISPVLLTILIAVLLGAVTVNRNQDWEGEMSLALDTAQASPDDPTAMGLLADAYFRWGRPDRAEELLRKALETAPENLRLHRSMGVLSQFLGSDSEALAHYQRAIELNPDHPGPYGRLAAYYRNRGHLGQARKYLAKAAQTFPYSSEIYNELAYMHYMDGQLEAAKIALEAAQKISPWSPAVQNNLEKVRQASKQ
ncbi:MAG: tetratricopeptide repeat protein [Acidobacteriota bacterium]